MELSATSRFPSCLDCGADRVGPFCHACGQGEVDPDATVRQLVGGTTRDFLSWDERAIRTLRVLLTRPGALSLAWAEGQRARFVPPLRLFLTLGLVLVALGTAYRWSLSDDLRPDRTVADTVDLLEPNTRNAGYWLAYGMKPLGLNVISLLAPLVGFSTFVLFHMRRPRLAPHLVHALHVGCVAVIGLIAWRLASLAWLASGPSQTLGDALDPTGSAFGALEILLLVWLGGVTAYAAVSIRRFYGTTRWRAVMTAPLVVIVPLAVLFGVLVGIYFVLLIR